MIHGLSRNIIGRIFREQKISKKDDTIIVEFQYKSNFGGRYDGRCEFRLVRGAVQLTLNTNVVFFEEEGIVAVPKRGRKAVRATSTTTPSVSVVQVKKADRYGMASNNLAVADTVKLLPSEACISVIIEMETGELQLLTFVVGIGIYGKEDYLELKPVDLHGVKLDVKTTGSSLLLQ